MRALCNVLTPLLLAGLVVSAAESAELKLTARVPSADSLLVGEPVVAWVRLENAGATPVAVREDLEPEHDTVRYLIQREGASETVFRPIVMKEAVGGRRVLQPREFIELPARLFFGTSGWTFKEPGRYTVRVIYGPGIEARVGLMVLAPTTDEDSRAAALFVESAEVGRFLILDGGDHLAEGHARLSEAARLPSSRLASYANVALGLNLATDFADIHAGSVRQADPILAADHLRRATQDTLNAYFDARAMVRLAALYEGLNMKAAAERTKFDMRKLAARPGGGLSTLGLRAVMDKEKN